MTTVSAKVEDVLVATTRNFRPLSTGREHAAGIDGTAGGGPRHANRCRGPIGQQSHRGVRAVGACEERDGIGGDLHPDEVRRRGDHETVDVSAVLRPRPRPTTLKVPAVVAEKVPLLVMVPPGGTPGERRSPLASTKDFAAETDPLIGSIVTVRGMSRTGTWVDRSGGGLGAGGVTCASSQQQQRRTMVKSRDIASLRASLRCTSSGILLGSIPLRCAQP